MKPCGPDHVLGEVPFGGMEDEGRRLPSAETTVRSDLVLEGRDLTGLRSTATDARPWLRHAAWADDVHPLRDAPRIDWHAVGEWLGG